MSSLGEPTPASRLFEYITACLLPSASEYDLHLTVLIKGASGSGKRTVVRSIARKTGFHLLELDCFDLLGETDIKTEGQLRARIEKAISCSPCMVLLQNIEALARKSQALETGQEPPMSTILSECFATARQGWKSSGFPVIILATTCDVEKVPTGVLGLFKEEIGIEAPGESERLSILRSLTKGDIVAPDVSLHALAVQTAALVANDLVDLVRRARCAATERVFESIQDNDDLDIPLPDTVALVSTKRGTDQEKNSVKIRSRSPRFRIEDVQCAGLALTASDFNSALEQARNSYSESIGAPKIPNVTWDDVGGLANVKSDILDTIQLPLEHPELFADGLKKRSGESFSLVFYSSLFVSIFLTKTDVFRYFTLWATRNWKNIVSESRSDIMFSQLLLRERTRTFEHVHWRV
jgi:peroxin-6